MSKVRDEYVAAGCLKSNDKSRVYLLDSAGQIKHQTDISHLDYADVDYAIDRIETIAGNCLLMVHMIKLVSIVLVKDSRIMLIDTRAVYDKNFINAVYIDRVNSRILVNCYKHTLDMRLKLTFH